MLCVQNGSLLAPEGMLQAGRVPHARALQHERPEAAHCGLTRRAAGAQVRVQGEGLRTVELSLKDLQTRFKKHTITATLQCTGNRRDDLNSVKPVKGLEWSVGAPRRDLDLAAVPLHTSHGCKHACAFCALHHWVCGRPGTTGAPLSGRGRAGGPGCGPGVKWMRPAAVRCVCTPVYQLLQLGKDHMSCGAGAGAIGTAEFAGARLCDVLAYAGLSDEEGFGEARAPCAGAYVPECAARWAAGSQPLVSHTRLLPGGQRLPSGCASSSCCSNRARLLSGEGTSRAPPAAPTQTGRFEAQRVAAPPACRCQSGRRRARRAHAAASARAGGAHPV